MTGDVHTFVAYCGMHRLRVLGGGGTRVCEVCVLLRLTDWYPCSLRVIAAYRLVPLLIAAYRLVPLLIACYCGVQIGAPVDCVLLRRTDWCPC